MIFVMGDIPIDIMIDTTDPPTFAAGFNDAVEETQWMRADEGDIIS